MLANPFTLIAGLLNIAAAIWHFMRGELGMAVVWVSYAVATITLSFISGK